MTDLEYFNTIRKLLVQTRKAAQKVYFPGKAQFLTGSDVLIKKTDDFISDQIEKEDA